MLRYTKGTHITMHIIKLGLIYNYTADLCLQLCVNAVVLVSVTQTYIIQYLRNISISKSDSIITLLRNH